MKLKRIESCIMWYGEKTIEITISIFCLNIWQIRKSIDLWRFAHKWSAHFNCCYLLLRLTNHFQWVFSYAGPDSCRKKNNVNNCFTLFITALDVVAEIWNEIATSLANLFFIWFSHDVCMFEFWTIESIRWLWLISSRTPTTPQLSVKRKIHIIKTSVYFFYFY